MCGVKEHYTTYIILSFDILHFGEGLILGQSVLHEPSNIQQIELFLTLLVHLCQIMCPHCVRPALAQF